MAIPVEVYSLPSIITDVYCSESVLYSQGHSIADSPHKTEIFLYSRSIPPMKIGDVLLLLNIIVPATTIIARQAAIDPHLTQLFFFL